MARKPAAPPRTLSLEGDLDVFSIHQQWEKVQPLLTIENGSTEVNLSSVGDLDLSGLQLLCALDRDLSPRASSSRWWAPMKNGRRAFPCLGVDQLFGGGSA